MHDLTAAHEAIDNLWSGIRESATDVEIWGGEFPFDRASNSIDCWKIQLYGANISQHTS
jgi:hypothetical protein